MSKNVHVCVARSTGAVSGDWPSDELNELNEVMSRRRADSD